MKSPLAWEMDVAEVIEVKNLINDALRARGAGLVNYKARLRDARDKLSKLVDWFAGEGLDAAHEEAYMALFDALAFLTDAVRGPSIHPTHLEAAGQALERMLNGGVL